LSFPRITTGFAALLVMAVAVAAVPASANSATVYKNPVVGTFADPCTGETITLSGTVVNVVTQFTTDGVQHFAVEQAWQGVSAVGASGTMYRLINPSTGLEQVETDSSTGSVVVRLSQEFMVISQGPLDNFVLRTSFLLVGSAGKLDVSKQTFTTECTA